MGFIHRQEEEKVSKRICCGFQCNKCGHCYSDVDFIEWQEKFYYQFVGGFGSKFGDEIAFEIVLCQDCFYELLNPYVRRI